MVNPILLFLKQINMVLVDSVQFSDYTFTADDLPAFRYYRIKLLLISSDQCYVPRVKDLRVMALA